MARLSVARFATAVLLVLMGGWIFASTPLQVHADTHAEKLARLWPHIPMPSIGPNIIQIQAYEKVAGIVCRDHDVAKNLGSIYWSRRYYMRKADADVRLLQLITIQRGRSRVDPLQLCRPDFILFKNAIRLERPEDDVIIIGPGSYLIWDSGSLVPPMLYQEIGLRR